MNFYFSNLNLVILLAVSIALFSSCSKQKEIDKLGCVEGKTHVGEKKTYTIGSMQKKTFFEYLNNSTTTNSNGQIINSEMRWIPIDAKEECHTFNFSNKPKKN